MERLPLRLDLKEGEITSRARALRKAQAALARYADPGSLVSEELIAERQG